LLRVRNVEVRRVLIARYSLDRLLTGLQPVLLDHDVDTLGNARALYWMPMPSDEALVVLEVHNSTPDADGSRKPYLLRVPPTMSMCNEAVAWTFGMRAAEYRPLAETWVTGLHPGRLAAAAADPGGRSA